MCFQPSPWKGLKFFQNGLLLVISGEKPKRSFFVISGRPESSYFNPFFGGLTLKFDYCEIIDHGQTPISDFAVPAGRQAAG
jgi:hypothetical protein